MPRRMIDSDILEDKKFLSLSDKGRYMWIGLILRADDEGRGKCDFQTLKNKIFPQNHISLNKISKIFSEIRKTMNKNRKSILVYRINSETFYQLCNWKQYQHIREDRIKPSKLPAFPQPNDNQMATKRQPTDRIVKYSIDKYSIDKETLLKNKSFPKD